MLGKSDLEERGEQTEEIQRPPREESRYFFGPFELNLNEFSLLRDGRPCRIQPQPLRVLALLVSRADRLTTRDMLRREIWGEDIAVDHEHGLNFAINQIRTVLGDSAKHSRFVETVPRAGYRFVAEVRVETVEPAAEIPGDNVGGVTEECSEEPIEDGPPLSHGPADTAKPAPGLPWPLRQLRGGLSRTLQLLSLVALILIATIWSQRGSEVPVEPTSTESPIRIAVLPFDGGGEPAAAKGMTFDLIASLGRLAPGKLEVIGHRSTMQFRDVDFLVSEIGRRLNVAFVVEGQVTGDGEVFRVKAMMTDVRDETARWSTSMVLPAADLVSAHRGLAVQIVKQLLPNKMSRGRVEGDPSLPLDPKVYATFADARWNFSSGSEDAAKAVEALREVVRLEPDFALGQAVLASSLALHAFASDQRDLPEAFHAAETALRLDPLSAEAHFALGMLRAYSEWKLEEGRDLISRALELEPGNAIFVAAQAGLMTVLGEPETAAVMSDLAIRLDPLAGNAWLDAGYADYLGGRFEKGRSRCERSLELGTSSAGWAATCFLNSSESLGDQEGVDRAIGRFFETSDSVARVPKELPSLDRVRLFRRRLVEARLAANTDVVLDYMIATETAALGQRETTMRHLEASFRRKDLLLPLAAVDPVFELLHDDPRFVELMARVRRGEQPE